MTSTARYIMWFIFFISFPKHNKTIESRISFMENYALQPFGFFQKKKHLELSYAHVGKLRKRLFLISQFGVSELQFCLAHMPSLQCCFYLEDHLGSNNEKNWLFYKGMVMVSLPDPEKTFQVKNTLHIRGSWGFCQHSEPTVKNKNDPNTLYIGLAVVAPSKRAEAGNGESLVG